MQFVGPLMQTLNFPNQDGGVKNRKLVTRPPPPTQFQEEMVVKGLGELG